MPKTRDQTRRVETNCNIILKVLRENPKIGRSMITTLAKKEGGFTLAGETSLGKYLSGLVSMGYIKRQGVYRPVYTAILNKPFKYPRDRRFLSDL